MVYCAECVRSNYCIDMRKNHEGSVACNKYKDVDYNHSFRDGDCDFVRLGIFSELWADLSESERDKKFGKVGSLANS